MTFFAFRPSNFTAGAEGAGIDDVDIVIRNAKIIHEDEKTGQKRDGSAYKIDACTALSMEFEIEGREENVHWSFRIGAPEFVQPTGDGEGFQRPDGTEAKLSGRQPAGQFIIALVKAGLPEEEIGEKASSLNGIKFHNSMVKEKYISNGVEKTKESGTPTPVKYIGRVATSGKTATASAEADDSTLVTLIEQVVADAPKEMTVVELNAAVTKLAESMGIERDTRTAMARQLIKMDALKKGAAEGKWKLGKGNVIGKAA